MAANTAPIFGKLGNIQSSGSTLIRAVATNLNDGSGTIGTDVFKCFTADATNGSWVQKLRLKYVGNSTTTSVACIINVFVCSVTSGATTDANCWMIDSVTVPAQGTISTTAAAPLIEIPLGFALPPSYTICCKISVAQPASHGFIGTVFGADY